MSLSLSSNPSIHYGSRVDISIKNTGNDDCTFRRPVSEKGTSQYDNLIVEAAEKKRLPYVGPTVFNRNSVRLSPGEDFEFSVNVGRNYPLVDGEEYSVRYAVACKENGYEVFITEEALVKASLQLNPDVKKQIRKDPTDAVVEAMPGIFRGGHNFIGTHNDKLIDQTLEATKAALRTLENLKDKDPAGFLKHYNDFVCSSREAPHGDTFANSVQKTYSDAVNFLNNKITYSFSGRECDPDTFGYVYAQDPGHVVYLCQQFIHSHILPDNSDPYDSKLGTIVHEVAHKVNHNVIDNYYGLNDCLDRLQKTNCTDTNDAISRLGTCPTDEADWQLEEAKQGKRFNLNMYTADCLQFLAENAYAKDNENHLSSTLIKVSFGLAVIGAGYFLVNRHWGQHQHVA